MVKAEAKAPVNKHNTQKNKGSFFREGEDLFTDRQPEIQPFFNSNATKYNVNYSGYFFNKPFVQPKLNIDHSGENNELEADDVANDVMQQGASKDHEQGQSVSLVNRKCEKCRTIEESEIKIQRLEFGETIENVASTIGSFFSDRRTSERELRSIPRHRPEREENSAFCTPYTSSTEAIAAKVYLIGALPAASAGMFGTEVSSIWIQYLRGPSGRRFYGNNTTIGRGFATSEVIRNRVNMLMRIAASRPHLYNSTAPNTWEEIPVEQIFNTDEINFPINFSNPFDIPGHIAGGTSGSDVHGADSRQLTGTLRVYREVDDSGDTQSVRLESNFAFVVRDTVDFCPGGAGAGLEQVLTIPLSRLEATGMAWDVAFQVDFQPAEARLTLPGTVLNNPPTEGELDEIYQPRDRRGSRGIGDRRR